MVLFFEILFWLSIVAILISYLFYPLLLKILSKNKKLNTNLYSNNEELPFVSILISAFNEEDVIEKKIDSIFNSQYPNNKFEVLIGSDASTDNTNNILEKLSKKYNSLYYFNLEDRQGKGNIINKLEVKSKGEILIITDANIIFSEDVIFNLIRHFKNTDIGLVDSQIINTGLDKSGISIQEKSYISREAKIKSKESITWGSMMGPFGGCYAVRKNLYEKIPPTYLVDDFFINMIVLDKNHKAINDLEAIVFEDVSNDLYIEFKRKIRIATGNFQNLFHFIHLLWPPYKGIAISFLSHKVLRWFGPFFILIIFLCNLLLLSNPFYYYFFIFQCFIAFLALFDFFMRKIGIHILFLRFITHFLSMNLAMLIGFFRFIIGVKSNVWQPTKRNQG